MQQNYLTLEIANISSSDIDAVALGWDLPRHSARTDFELLDPPLPGRLWDFDCAEEFLADALGWKMALGRMPDLVFVPHHRAHAASAFHASGFDDAAVLVVDGEGDDESISIFEAHRGAPLVRRAHWPRSASLGLMYEAVTEAIGLSTLEAGKTMGLAAYGVAAEMAPWPMLEFDGDRFTKPFAASNVAGYDDIKNGWRRHIERLGYVGQKVGSQRLHEDRDAVRLAHSAQLSVQQVMKHLVSGDAVSLRQLDASWCWLGGWMSRRVNAVNCGRW